SSAEPPTASPIRVSTSTPVEAIPKMADPSSGVSPIRGGPTRNPLNFPPPVVSFASPTATAINESAGTLSLAAQLDRPATEEIKVGLSTTSRDLVLPSPAIARFHSSEKNTEVRLRIENDEVRQGNRTVGVTLQEGPGYTLGSPSRVDIHIADDEPLPN